MPTEPPLGRLANVAGAVLLGGASTRMGEGVDKAHLEWGGVAFATRIARLLSEIVEEVLLVGGAPPAAAPGRRVPDPDGPRCALRGLVGALEAATAERVLVIATDAPRVSADLLLALTAWPESAAVAPRRDGIAQPLCAIYRPDLVLEVARTRLRDGELRLHGLLDAVDTDYLEGADLAAIDPDGRALVNVNTPAELDALGLPPD